MKTKQIVCLFIALVFGATLFSLSVFAADNNLTPYTPGGSQVEQDTDSSSSGGGKNTPDYAGQLFQETEFSKNETVTEVTTTIAKIASAFITCVLGVLTSLLTISMVIDICCLLFKPLTRILAKAPIQLFTDEVSAITGIQYVGNTEGAASENVEKVDLKGKPAFLYYLEKRALLIFPAVIILILLGTGLLFDGVFFFANKIVAVIDNFLH